MSDSITSLSHTTRLSYVNHEYTETLNLLPVESTVVEDNAVTS